MKVLVFVLLVSACVPKSEKTELAYYEVEQNAFNKYINAKPMPAEPNLSVDTSIANVDYPIEIALYQDQKFYYNLPTLGDGEGTWEKVGGKLKLFATRTLFDMNIDIFAANPDATQVILKFRDRHGPQVIKMDNFNLAQ